MRKFIVILSMLFFSVGCTPDVFIRNFFAKNFYAELDGKLVYNSYSLRKGVELSILDGEMHGREFDLYPGINSSAPREFIKMDNDIYFTANEPKYGFELWKYSQKSGPVLFKDLYPGRKGSFPAYFTPCGGRLFFTADLPNMGRELVALDLNTEKISSFDLESGSASSYPLRLACFREKLFFVIKDVPVRKGIYSINKSLELVFEYPVDPAGADLFNINEKILLVRLRESLHKYVEPGVIDPAEFLDLYEIPDDVVSSISIWKVRLWEEPIGELPYCNMDRSVHKFNYLYNVGESIYIQRGVMVAKMDALTKKITPIKNAVKLKLHEFYSFVKLGDVHFSRARRIDTGKIIEVYFKDDGLFEYRGLGSMYDLIYFDGKYFARESMLSEKLVEIKL